MYCRKLADYLLSHPSTNLDLLSNTLINYREHYEYRFAILVKDAQEAIDQMANVTDANITKSKANRQSAFYFCHQGLQYPNMESQLGLDTYSDKEDINDPSIGSALLFNIFAKIIDFLKRYGLPAPMVVFGHSLGEYGALFAAGAFDYDNGLEFLKERGRLFKKTERAKMFAIHIEDNYPHERLHLSAILSSNLRTFVCAEEHAVEVKESLG